MSSIPTTENSQTNFVYSNRILLPVSVCFILSGATGLIYEVLWARMLGLVFGATTFAVSTVLAAFMGGLALGSAWAGRVGPKVKRPLRAYGLLEIGIALYALAVPLLFRAADSVYALVWQRFHPGFFAFSTWRFALSCALLLVPTVLMGATLPVLSAALLRSPVRSETTVARLYTCNLAGAILGTLVAGFVLLPFAGVRTTILVAAVANLAIGATAILVDRSLGRRFEASDDDSSAVEHSEVNGEPRGSNVNGGEREGGKNFWFLCAAVSGFVTISVQVAWSRVLTMIIGSSTYAFSIVVALFLLGLATGSYLVSRKQGSKNLLKTVLTIELVTAFTLVLSIAITNQAPTFLWTIGLQLQINSWSGLMGLQILVAALIVLIPAGLMGMIMPLVLVWAGRASGEMESVRLVGRSYAVNTLGAIMGAWGAGFLLIPKASVRFTILFAAALCVIVAGVAYRPKKIEAGLGRALAAGATLALVVLLFIIAPALNLDDLSKGVYDSFVRVLARSRGSGSDEPNQATGPETHKLLMFYEGPTATVSVREDWGIRSLAINGRTNASDRDDMPTQVMLGQLPMLVAPRADNALVVGYGSGVTVGAMLQSEIKSLACVELEPRVIQADEFFNHVNHAPLGDPRLKLIVDDARAYLRVNPARYDIIVSEPSHPWVPGVANLFTREFFELGRSRLNDEGVFAQWLQTYQLSTESIRTVLATFRSVFPHVLVFRVGGAARGKDLILIGSNVPLSLAHVSERIVDPLVRAELARVGMDGSGALESWYVCDESQLDAAVAGAAINTDDNMLVETRAPREAFVPSMKSNADWIEELARNSRGGRPSP
ncbi:MAG TPA: fused MFS/spermidine synthase [Pyrinomonadaceae bacterium]|nr:fused MFS/spermidine synthase [Pyrinomonadaceae bacterium]